MTKRPLTGRQFNLLLYPDDPLYSLRLDTLNSNYRWVGIEHDRDIDADGEILKPHIHVVARLPSAKPTTLKSFADRLQLPYELQRDENNKISAIVGCHAEVCRNYQRSLRYLVHADDLDKYQYSTSSLFGSSEMIKDVLDAVKKKSIDEKVIDLFDLLDNTHCYLNESEFARLVAGAGLWSALKSTPHWIIQPALEAHNAKYIGFPRAVDF